MSGAARNADRSPSKNELSRAYGQGNRGGLESAATNKTPIVIVLSVWRAGIVAANLIALATIHS